jgi:hypothetical protein
MGRSAWARALRFKVLNQGPVKEGKEGPRLGDEGIMVEHGGHGGLVKNRGSRYHHKQLLLWVNGFFCDSAKGVLLWSRTQDESPGTARVVRVGNYLLQFCCGTVMNKQCFGHSFDATRRGSFEL